MQDTLFSFLTKFSGEAIWSKLKLIISGQNGITGNNKQGPDERTLISTNDIPLPSLSNQLSEEPYPQIYNVAHPLDHMSPGFTHGADAYITSSIALENISQKLAPRAEDGNVVLAVYCLGQFRVSLENQWISSWPSGKGKSILKFMIVNYPRPISKDVLMDTLWRDADPVSARNNLYVAIYGLRQAFKVVMPGFNPILFEEDRYCLNPDISVWLDVNEFMRYYQNGLDYERRGRLVEGIREYELAESLYQGDFFEEDLYEDWPVPRREALKDTYLIILDRLSRYYFDEERYAICIQTCQKILTKDNFREDAYRRLMRCYCRQGQRPLALRQYQLCTEVLARELGVPPAQETTALYQHIRNEGVV
jgi:DNA-binding SARP family transcriptional activator